MRPFCHLLSPSMRRARPLWLALGMVWLGSVGCAHRSTITSDPPGAEVRLKRQYLGVTPLEVEVGRWPWSPRTIQVSTNGRRWTTVKLSRWKRKSEHEVLLIRKHGRAGTWTPDEAQP